MNLIVGRGKSFSYQKVIRIATERNKMA